MIWCEFVLKEVNMSEERRSNLRVNVYFDGTYKKKPGLGQENFFRAKNISQGGICFFSEEKLNPTESLELNIFIIEGLLPITAEGKVVWAREVPAGAKKKYEIGVQFLKINEENKIRIEEFVTFMHKMGK
jgi:c-di-GMP-binding flagellar brake protein YcgR